MADIDQIIAGGAGSSSRADFSGIPKILDYFYKSKDEAAKNDLRDAFKGGVPTTADGQPDFSAMAKTLFQKGGLSEGTAAANLGIAQQNQQFGQGQSAGIQRFENGQAPIISPSTNRSVPIVSQPQEVAQPTAQPARDRGDQPGSIVGLVSSAGIPDELAGPIIQQVSAATRMDPNSTVNPQMTPRVQQIVAEAVRRHAGQPQMQAAPQQAQSPKASPRLSPTLSPPRRRRPRPPASIRASPFMRGY
jgi:hypothetical protein